MPLVLVNGLAEQPESWFANRLRCRDSSTSRFPRSWSTTVTAPPLDRRRRRGHGRLPRRSPLRFLDEFVQRPPYHLVGSSLGSQVILTLCRHGFPKGLQDRLDLPVGLSRRRKPADDRGRAAQQLRSLVRSVFHRDHFASDELVGASIASSRTENGKKACCGPCGARSAIRWRSLLPRVPQPTLVIWGAERSRALRRARLDPGGRANPPGAPGGDPQVRPRAADREAGW